MPWRQAVKRKALDYLQNCRGQSFFIGGQSGSGKTHICTAIAGEIMQRGGRLRYFRWVEDGRRLKQMLGDRELYERELRQWTDAPFLYIDDLYKQEITDADIRLLYEILNGRYNNDMPTILSSERNLEQIRHARGGDWEALAGRIYEMCGSGRYCIELSGAEKSYRFYGQRAGDNGGLVDKDAQVGQWDTSDREKAARSK
jgi:DNA replication protein DnaC